MPSPSGLSLPTARLYPLPPPENSSPHPRPPTTGVPTLSALRVYTCIAAEAWIYLFCFVPLHLHSRIFLLSILYFFAGSPFLRALSSSSSRGCASHSLPFFSIRSMKLYTSDRVYEDRTLMFREPSSYWSDESHSFETFTTR